MNEYSVAPNRDASKWIVKIEDVAPEQTYDDRESAIEEAEKLAQENKPSRVLILNENHEVEDEKSFN